jgi:hypothetical protein
MTERGLIENVSIKDRRDISGVIFFARIASLLVKHRGVLLNSSEVTSPEINGEKQDEGTARYHPRYGFKTSFRCDILAAR